MNQRVSDSIHRIVILAGITTGLLGIASPAFAADDEQTASRKSPSPAAACAAQAPVGSAVIALDRDDITASGQVTVDRIIKEIPQNFDLGVSENSRGQSGGAGNIVYGNTVNLRGIGPYATLVIVDGHRVTNNSRSTDPSILPTLGVERVEVVADGASAIYGSDAIAGVVNIIPRRALDGVEVFGRAGISESGDFNENIIGAAWGKTWASGQAMVAYEHADRDNLPGTDRDFFRSDQTGLGGRDYRITRCNPGTLRVGTTNPVTYAIPAGGLTPANAGTLVPGTVNRCDELVGQDLFPEQGYDTVNATATQEINDWFGVFFDGFYSERDFYRHSAYATATLNVPQTNAWFVRPAGFTGTTYQIDYSFINDLAPNDSYRLCEELAGHAGPAIPLPADWLVEALFAYGETRDDVAELSRHEQRGAERRAGQQQSGNRLRSLRLRPHFAGRARPHRQPDLLRADEHRLHGL